MQGRLATVGKTPTSQTGCMAVCFHYNGDFRHQLRRLRERSGRILLAPFTFPVINFHVSVQAGPAYSSSVKTPEGRLPYFRIAGSSRAVLHAYAPETALSFEVGTSHNSSLLQPF